MVILLFYICPFCGNNLNIDEDGICSNCNNELVVINNKIYIKNLYESLYAMNDSINTTMEDAQTTKEEIEFYLNHPSRIFMLSKSEKQKILNDISTQKKALVNFTDSLYDIVNDPIQVQALKSMDDIFGDMETKLNDALLMAREQMVITTQYESLVKSDDYKNTNAEFEVREYHEIIDNFYNGLLEEDIDDFEENKHELDCNPQLQDTFLNNVLDTEKELTSTKEILLNEFTTEKLYYLKQYDDVCGDIEEKLQRTYSKMDEILEVIDRIKTYIHSLKNKEEVEDSNLPLNNGRVLDL